MTQVVLASQSPRRKDLLHRLIPQFTVCPCEDEEVVAQNLSPQEAVMALALHKAQTVGKIYPQALTIGADTAVFYQETIFGKPHSEQEAFEQLSFLQGRTHQVVTGVALHKQGKTEQFFVCTDVLFYPLSSSEIKDYIRTGEFVDKAGSYAIQGKGALLVKGIAGDYYNVVGLPIATLWRKMQKYL